MVHYFEPMVTAATGSASHLLNSKQQMMMLDQSRTVTECAIQLVYAAKEAGGNPKATHVHTDLDESAEAMKEALRDLLSTVETVATEAGVVSGLVDTITASMNQMETSAQTVIQPHPTHPSTNPIKLEFEFSSILQVATGDDMDGNSFVDYQTRMVQATKEIARLSQEMVKTSTSSIFVPSSPLKPQLKLMDAMTCSKSNRLNDPQVTKSESDVNQLGPLGAAITHHYSQLAQDTQGAVMKTTNVDIAMRIKSCVHDLGQACIEMVKTGGARQGAPRDVFTQRDLTDAARVVAEKVPPPIHSLFDFY